MSLGDMAQECRLLTLLAAAPSTTKKIALQMQCLLKAIHTRAGQTSEGPRVLSGSDKLHKGSNCFDDYQEILHLPGWAVKLVRSSQLSYEFFNFFAATCFEAGAPLEGAQCWR